jgi:hypothetical protein
MSLDSWQALGIVCGALLALTTLVGLVYRKVIRPVWRAAWRTIKRFNLVADQLLGDKEKGIPSMTERMSKLEKQLGEHLEWHDPKRRANGPRPGSVQPRPGARP